MVSLMRRCFGAPATSAVRCSDWKLQLSDPDETAFLYNLAVDPTEQRNLAESESKQLARLKQLLNAGVRD